jgi:hypothetical protein
MDYSEGDLPKLVKREVPLEITYSREQHQQSPPELLRNILSRLNQFQSMRIVSAVKYEVELNEKPTGRSNHPKSIYTRVPVLRMKTEIYASDRNDNRGEPNDPHCHPSPRASPYVIHACGCFRHIQFGSSPSGIGMCCSTVKCATTVACPPPGHPNSPLSSPLKP